MSSLKKISAGLVLMICLSLPVYGFGKEDVFEDKLYLYQNIINSNECFSDFSETRFEQFMNLFKTTLAIRNNQVQAWDSFLAAKKEMVKFDFREIAMYCSEEALKREYALPHIKNAIIKELDRDTQLAKNHLLILEEYNQAARELMMILDEDQIQLAAGLFG